MADKIRFFRVRNLEKFQHYKDRSPPWIKLYADVLEKYEFGRLPDASKAHLLAIWLLASRSDNRLPFDPDWIAKRINATQSVELDLLLAFDFIEIIQEEEQSASKQIAKRSARDRDRDREETEKEKTDGATAPPSASPEPEVQKVQSVSRETIELPADPLKADDELVDDAPPTTVARRGTRLPIDWVPSPEDIAFCRTHRPDLDPGATADAFRDYWIAKAGSGGVKLDWHATWRTWVRRQQAPKTPAFRTRDDDRAETIRQLRAGEI